MSKKRKIIITIIVIGSIALMLTGLILYKISPAGSYHLKPEKELRQLPKPELAGGSRGEMGIDKNVNEETIDEYLDREDSVYRDMRMLEDPANYEAIGGDRFLSGYIKGFEVVPLPYIIPVTGLPSEVGETYKGETLFDYVDGKYIANYQESYDIIKELFPHDKVIFLMCGGGGYAGMMKNFLITLGWDADKIYNIGGYWYYNGKNDVRVKKLASGEYDFSKVPYHKIEFSKLTKIEKPEEKQTSVEEVKISTSSITLEKDTSFKLSAVVLPNEAINKSISWSSSNEAVATVEWGVVVAKGEGTATITVTTEDGNKTATCEVTVTAPTPVERIILDDISAEVQQYNQNDPDVLYNEYMNLINDSEGNLKEEYKTYTPEGYYTGNELQREEYRKYEERANAAIQLRTGILNNLIENKKSFIIIQDAASCQKKDFSLILTAQEILKNNNYQYLFLTSREDTFSKSKIYFDNFMFGNIVIVKNGEVYGYTDPFVYSFNSENEVKAWLNKYIEIN